MRKAIFFTIGFLLTFTVVTGILKTDTPRQAKADIYSQEEITRIKKLVKPSPVCAIINENCQTFNNIDNFSPSVTLKQNTPVTILKDKSCQYYYVQATATTSPVWVASKYLDIPKDPDTNFSRMTSEDISTYINILGLKSDTDKLLWVDIDRQITHLLTYSNNKWELEKTFVCSTGKNVSPTTRGLFKTSDKGEWFYSERLGSGAKYYIRFNGSYLLHSVAMDKDQNIIDPILGERRSSGCVRFSVDDIKYLYSIIENGTTVYIN